ncbi:MAG TPA: hypothetical protein VF702_07515 [Allosphingosinicella sp.]|jgi:hypothetical protein
MLSAIVAMFLLASPSSGAAPRPASPAVENPDQVICRAPAPVLGSRVARRRICRTRAEWRAFEVDRAQMRRDLNAGNCAGASSCSCNGPDC